MGPSLLHPLSHETSNSLQVSLPSALPPMRQSCSRHLIPAPGPPPPGLVWKLPGDSVCLACWSSPDLSVLWASLPPLSSLYICLMNISISRAQLFPLNKQSADFIAGLLLTYLFRALNHSQEKLSQGKPGVLAMGRSCQHLPCRAWGMPCSHKPALRWK